MSSRTREYIDSAPAFESAVRRAQQCSWVAVDIEFFRRTSYFARFCLLQLAGDEVLAVVDAQALPATTLNQGLRALSDHPLLIFHSPDQDLEIWYRRIHKMPRRIFDTQVALTLAGLGLQTGLATAIATVFDRQLDKQPQADNWSRRPLSSRQIDYAFAEVEQLSHLYQYLCKRLSTSAWKAVCEEGDQLCRKLARPIDKNTLWWRVSEAARQPPRVQAVLQELAICRQEIAERRDRAVRKVVSDDALTALAVSENWNGQLLHPECRHLFRAAWKRGKELPLCSLCRPSIPSPANSSERARISALRALLRPCAEAYALDVNQLAGKARLLAWLRCPDRPLFPYGWRRYVAGGGDVGRVRMGVRATPQRGHDSVYISLFDHLRDLRCSAALIEVLRDVVGGCKDISWYINQGDLAGIIGASGGRNVQGEEQQKLDVIANDLIKSRLLANAWVAGIASEEEESVVSSGSGGGYAVLFDPLDGSSNIGVNVSVGTIFSVLRAQSQDLNEATFLQPGKEQLAAGYVLYGASTQLVLTIGKGVHLYQLDHNSGEFLLVRESVKIVPEAAEFAINASNQRFWQPQIRAYVDACLSGEEGPFGKRYNMRWVASMVADLHRILVRGGIFLYPWDSRDPQRAGKLRLLYEANPMSMIVEQAGGKASNSEKPIVDIQPDHIHQRVALIIGSAREVDACLGFFSAPRERTDA